MSGFFCMNCVSELPEDIPQGLVVECVVKVEGKSDVTHTLVCKLGDKYKLIHPPPSKNSKCKPCIEDKNVKVEVAFSKQKNIYQFTMYRQTLDGKKWVKYDKTFNSNNVKETQLDAGKYQIYFTCLFCHDIKKKVAEVRAEKAEQKAKELANTKEAPEVPRSGQAEEAMEFVPTNTDDADMSEQVLGSGDGAMHDFENAEALDQLQETGVNDMLVFDVYESTNRLPTNAVKTTSMEGGDKVETCTLADGLPQASDGSDNARPLSKYQKQIRKMKSPLVGDEERLDSSGDEGSSVEDSSDEDVIELARELDNNRKAKEAAKAEEAERKRKAEEAQEAADAERVRLAEAERVRKAEEAARKRKADAKDEEAAKRRKQQLQALLVAEKQRAASQAQPAAQGNTVTMPVAAAQGNNFTMPVAAAQGNNFTMPVAAAQGNNFTMPVAAAQGNNFTMPVNKVQTDTKPVNKAQTTTKPKPQGRTNDGNVIMRSSTLADASKTKR